MGEYVLCEKQDLVGIADAIRAKQNSIQQFSVSELAKQIKNISGSSTYGGAAVTFHKNGATGKFYYLQYTENGGHQLTEEYFGSGKDLTIQVAKHTFIYSPNGYFDGTTFIVPDDGFTIPIDSYCFYVGGSDNVEIFYADGAPS